MQHTTSIYRKEFKEKAGEHYEACIMLMREFFKDCYETDNQDLTEHHMGNISEHIDLPLIKIKRCRTILNKYNIINVKQYPGEMYSLLDFRLENAFKYLEIGDIFKEYPVLFDKINKKLRR